MESLYTWKIAFYTKTSSCSLVVPVTMAERDRGEYTYLYDDSGLHQPPRPFYRTTVFKVLIAIVGVALVITVIATPIAMAKAKPSAKDIQMAGIGRPIPVDDTPIVAAHPAGDLVAKVETPEERVERILRAVPLVDG